MSGRMARAALAALLLVAGMPLRAEEGEGAEAPEERAGATEHASEPEPLPTELPAEPESDGARAAEPAPLGVDVVPAEATSESADEEDLLFVVELKDGQILRGYLVADESTYLVLELAGGGRIRIERKTVASLRPAPGARLGEGGEILFENDHASRYFYAPSALRPKAGYGYFSQKQLVFSEFAYGVTDEFSLMVGAVVPAWFVGMEGFNFMGGAKLGVSPTEYVHLALGAQALVIPAATQAGAVGVFFGGATVGDADAQVTVDVGWPFTVSGRVQEVGELVTVVAGSYRFSPHFAVMTENWILPLGDWGGTLPVVFSAGLRLMWERLATDAGLVWQPSLPFPIPWLGFSWAFQIEGPKAESRPKVRGGSARPPPVGPPAGPPPAGAGD